MPAGFISEWWPASNRNGGRLHVGKPGRNKSESAPSSHPCALDFFLAGEAYDLIASDRSWFGAEAWAARTKRLASRHLGRQVVGKCQVLRSAVARTVAYRRPRRSISIRCRAALI